MTIMAGYGKKFLVGDLNQKNYMEELKVKKYIKQVKQGLAALMAAIMVMAVTPVGVLADLYDYSSPGYDFGDISISNVVSVEAVAPSDANVTLTERERTAIESYINYGKDETADKPSDEQIRFTVFALYRVRVSAPAKLEVNNSWIAHYVYQGFWANEELATIGDAQFEDNEDWYPTLVNGSSFTMPVEAQAGDALAIIFSAPPLAEACMYMIELVGDTTAASTETQATTPSTAAQAVAPGPVQAPAQPAVAPAPAQTPAGFPLHETIIGERYSDERYHTFTVFLDNEPTFGTVTEYNLAQRLEIEEKCIFIPIGTTLKAAVQETNGSTTNIAVNIIADYPEQLSSYDYVLSKMGQKNENIFTLRQEDTEVSKEALPQEMTYVFDKPGVFELNGTQSVKSNADMSGVVGFDIYIVVTDGDTPPETQTAVPATVTEPTAAQIAPAVSGTGNATAIVDNCYFLNIRRSPNLDSAPFAYIAKGDTVTILEAQSKWYKVSTVKGEEGWVDSGYLTAQ